MKAKDRSRERSIFRRISVTLAAQILSLLDVFIFPDSLDASLPASQLHGLALVRSTETRVGDSQGPLLTSLVRLSLLLMAHLEPCSVKLLQCSSRLRCFLFWILELIRESETLEGYSAAFNQLTAPFDRLILAIILQCHRTLGRCGSLLSEIESTPYETYFESKEAQKKSYRRLLRVVLELRDILSTTYERRKDVLRTSLTQDAYGALQACLESPVLSSSNDTPQSKAPFSKEMLVRRLLLSDWVTKFQDVDISRGIVIPCMLKVGNESTMLSSKDTPQGGTMVMQDLSHEATEIVKSFEKALNACFEKYLESQRKWAETGAVRDLEFEGDTTLKRLSGRHAIDLSASSKTFGARNAAADIRWGGINRKVVEVWKEHSHWKPRYTDHLGRRILLVRNRDFNNHAEASYELLMGREREKEEKEREERFRKKQELAEVMKRNTDAFVPYSQEAALEEDDEEDDDEEEKEQVGEVESDKEATERQDEVKFSESEFYPTNDASKNEAMSESTAAESHLEGGDDVDAWAKTFIWSDNESVVARFSSVMIVTLQHRVEGKLLLTTHGLYFHQTGDEINVITRQPVEKLKQYILDAKDRRWKLSRLTEVHSRRYMLRAQALELFFSDSHELFLNFLDGNKERNRFYAKLRNSCKVMFCTLKLDSVFADDIRS